MMKQAGSSRAGLGDVMRLGARMGAGYLRRGRAFDVGEAGLRWARELVARGGGAGVRLPVPGRHIELVGSRDASEHVLCPHAANGYTTAQLKSKAMSFLAPQALTIADGAAWARLRPFNESVLTGGAAHPSAPAFLAATRAAFARPVRDRAAVRAAMAQAMASIVMGEGDDARQAAGDVGVLFDVVQSPLRRALLGWHYRSRRTRLFATLDRRWNAAGAADTTLIARARRLAPHDDRAELLDQLPHWMFTFTGSGTDLLTRTLALIGARPDVRARVLREVAEAGPPDRAESVAQLAYVNACLLETGRLFPPVTRTFHAAPDGTQLVHYFPLLQRDDALGPTVHAFRPERWLERELDAAAAASNLFLRGPRACPGMDLILFVCATAIARQIGELQLSARSERLARDPLPITFREREARFTTSDAHVTNAESRS